jgi:ATP-dependent DNA ligase
VAHTPDIQVAQAWLAVPCLEGVLAKRVDRPYVASRGRDWVKVNRQRTIDCTVVGITGDLSVPRLVLGLRHGDGGVAPLTTMWELTRRGLIGVAYIGSKPLIPAAELDRYIASLVEEARERAAACYRPRHRR